MNNQQQQFLMQLLSNPETAAFFQDPEFLQKLQEIQTNPMTLQKHMEDPKVKKAFEVLSQGFKGGPGQPGPTSTGMSEEDLPKPPQAEQPKKPEPPKETPASKAPQQLNFEAEIAHYDNAIKISPNF